MRRTKPKKRGVLGGFISAIVTALLVLLVALATAVAIVPAVANGVALTVLSGSMEPAIHPGDVVVVKRVNDPAEIEFGDVITFMPNPNDPTLITHRVIGFTNNPIDGPGFTTQGDANNAPDQPILAKQVRGKLMYTVPYVGWGTNWVKQHAPWLVTAVGIGLITFGLWSVIASKRRRAPVPVTTAPGAEAPSQGSAQPAEPAGHQAAAAALPITDQPPAGAPSHVGPAPAVDRPADAQPALRQSAGRVPQPVSSGERGK